MRRIFHSAVILFLCIVLPCSMQGCRKGSPAAYLYKAENGEKGELAGTVLSTDNRRMKLLAGLMEDRTTEVGTADPGEVAWIVEVVMHDGEGKPTDPADVLIWFRHGEVWFSVEGDTDGEDYIHKSNSVSEEEFTAMAEGLRG